MSNGDPLTYTNWLPGEPSNSGGLEHYGEMNWRAPGKWNDATNTPPGRGIVELTSGPPAGGVLAASLALAGLILAVVVRVRRRLGESGK